MGRNRPGHRRKQTGSASPPSVQGKKSTPLWLVVKRLAYWSLVLAVWGSLMLAGVVAYYAYDLPDPAALDTEYRTPGITLLAADGAVLGTAGPVHAEPVALAELPATLPRAVLAIEDRRFYLHSGVDWFGVARAAIRNLLAGRVVQGGSTITQQLAKNLFLTSERSFRRKIRELLLALWLEHRFTKDQLLTIYLNRVYLGGGTYGVEAAAWRYFGKTVRDLSLPESAMIAGLLKAPSRYAPTRDLLLAQSRAGQVLDRMVASGWLEQVEAAAAKRSPARPTGAYIGSGGARYFVDWVLERVPSYVGAPRQDLIIDTSLQPAFQQAGEKTLAASLNEAIEVDANQAALIALGPDGAVRAMIGGRDYRKSQFNRATQARRQPGSAFKLFVYLAALNAGFKPSDQFIDEAVEIDGWRPRNYDGLYKGKVTLREAFAQSINTVAVRLTERVGREQVIAMARRLGVTGLLRPTPSLALGTAETTLLELTTAYASVANGGRVLWPYGIVEIRNRKGIVLYHRKGSHVGQAITPGVASSMDDLLQAVVTGGTGRSAGLLGAAGKTGTSQDCRDAWFIGYRGENTAGIWLGNEGSTPMDRVTGGGLPARLWRTFMVAVQP